MPVSSITDVSMMKRHCVSRAVKDTFTSVGNTQDLSAGRLENQKACKAVWPLFQIAVRLYPSVEEGCDYCVPD